MSDKEIWAIVPGYNGDYSISSIGRIMSKKFGKIRHMNPSINSAGYPYVGLSLNGSVKNHRIHRLVASAFISNPSNKPEVNHLNGDVTDSRVENLEWVTAKENTRHAFDVLGRKMRQLKGSLNPNAKLTEDIVRSIRESISSGRTTRAQTARSLGITKTTVTSIMNGRSWSHIKW